MGKQIPIIRCPKCHSTRFESHKQVVDTYNASILGSAGLAFFGPLGGAIGAMIGGIPNGDVFFVCLDCGCTFEVRK